ncbi:MAG: hypothetical protein P4L40_03375, partial [Terracidiphilus sp.]|nr:hypothetical protein [Terracidiphilus sp.]
MCAPIAMLHRMTRHGITGPRVDTRNITSILAYMCPPVETEYSAAMSGQGGGKVNAPVPVLPSLTGRFRPHTGRIVIWATSFASGGPEAWMQLWQALSRQGYNVSLFVTGIVAEYDPDTPTHQRVADRYEPLYGTPVYTSTLEDLAPGDILFSRQDCKPQFCDHVRRFRARGVRVYFWTLGMYQNHMDFLNHNCSSFFAHNEMTRLGVLSEHAVVRPYVLDRDGLGSLCPAARSGEFPTPKANERELLVTFDGDTTDEESLQRFVKGVQTSIQVQQLPASTSVGMVLVKGLNATGVYELLARNRVLIDRAMSGQERLPMEAVMCGNVFLTDDVGEGLYPEDIPLPRALVFPTDDGLAAGEAIVTAALCYEDWQPLMAPLFAKVTALTRQSMEGDVRRFMSSDFHFVIP